MTGDPIIKGGGPLLKFCVINLFSQLIQLDDGQWEFGVDVQGQMVKLAGPMIDKLGKGVNYPKFKLWISTFYDWIASHTHLSPE